MSRIDRVNEEMRYQVSMIVQNELNDPRLGFVTITRVSVSEDLKIANIYFTAIDKEKSYEETLKCLNGAAGFIRKLIGQRIRIRYTPQLRFIYDVTQPASDRIDEIIDKINKEKKE